MHHVIEQIADALGRDTADFGTAKKDWSAQNLFGIDKDSVSVRLSKSYLSLLGDGSTQVYRADSLRTFQWKERGDNLNAMIRDGAYTIAVTNPPFGTKLRFPAAYARAEGYVVRELIADRPDDDPEAGSHDDCDPGIVFLERALNLTREIAVLRSSDPARLSDWPLLVMMSLKVVNDQLKYLVMMQMNWEDSGDRLLELRIPVHRTREGRAEWEGHVKNYFEAMAQARSEYDALCREISVDRFIDRP